MVIDLNHMNYNNEVEKWKIPTSLQALGVILN